MTLSFFIFLVMSIALGVYIGRNPSRAFELICEISSPLLKLFFIILFFLLLIALGIGILLLAYYLIFDWIPMFVNSESGGILTTFFGFLLICVTLFFLLARELSAYKRKGAKGYFLDLSVTKQWRSIAFGSIVFIIIGIITLLINYYQ